MNSPAGYVELRASKVKTARSKEKKAELLPMSGPTYGLLTKDWGSHWLGLREQAGLLIGEGLPFFLKIKAKPKLAGKE
jgi:hypothetical protein